jgi:hypothetical protein
VGINYQLPASQFTRHCYGLNVSPPPNLYVELYLQCDGIQKQGPWEVTEFRWGQTRELLWWELHIYKRKRLRLPSQPWEDTARRQPPANQAERLIQVLTMFIQSSQPPDLWEINAYCLSHPVNGILLLQPKLRQILLPNFLWLSTAYWIKCLNAGPSPLRVLQPGHSLTFKPSFFTSPCPFGQWDSVLFLKLTYKFLSPCFFSDSSFHCLVLSAPPLCYPCHYCTVLQEVITRASLQLVAPAGTWGMENRCSRCLWREMNSWCGN